MGNKKAGMDGIDSNTGGTRPGGGFTTFKKDKSADPRNFQAELDVDAAEENQERRANVTEDEIKAAAAALIKIKSKIKLSLAGGKIAGKLDLNDTEINQIDFTGFDISDCKVGHLLTKICKVYGKEEGLRVIGAMVLHESQREAFYDMASKWKGVNLDSIWNGRSATRPMR